MAFTTTELIAAIKQRGTIATATGRFTNAVLLALADDEIRSGILPKLIGNQREEFFKHNHDVALNATGLYKIPSRSTAAALADLKLIASDGREYSLKQIREEQITDFDFSPIGQDAFFFRGNSVQLVPRAPAGYATLRFGISIRPSQLTVPAEAARITEIDTVTKIVTCSSVPTTFTASTLLDLVNSKPHFDLHAMDLDPVAVVTGTNGTIEFAALPLDLAVGDYVCLAGFSPVAQIPLEFHAILAQRVANIAMRVLGDFNGLKAGLAAVEEMEVAVAALTSPRISDEPKKINARIW